MKSVNIYSLCEIFKNVDCTQENKVSKINELLIKYFKKQTKNDPKERFIKDVEIDSLKTFCNFIIKHSKDRINKGIDLFNNFYVGYKIPQIGEEFDLLKFSSNYVTNIELKSKSSNNEILEQLQRHYYYLKFIGKENIALFTFVCKDNLLYKYDIKNDKIIEESGDNLIKILKENNICDNNIDIDNLFKPSNYLVSVFNSTEKFITDEYFLTNQQKNIKRDIIKSIDDNINNNNNFFLISGGAGTGKTLLLYDCAREFIKNEQNVLIIHVGNLNEGHIKLKNNNWNIISIKDIKLEDKSILEDNYYDVIIIDEIQRIWEKQFKIIIEYVKEKNVKCIMAGDQEQVFMINENGYELINYNELNIKKFELRDTIRTNKNILNFQKKLFDINRHKDIIIDSKNINIVYFTNKEDVQFYIDSKINYKFINYTPTQFPNNNTIDTINYFNTNLTSHSVIGQEFDNVIIFMDNYFCYDEKNKLQEKKRCGNPYIQLKMLYQNITRTKHNLEIVIIDNFELYEKILEIF